MNNIQKMVKDFCNQQEMSFTVPPHFMMLNMVSELGQMANDSVMASCFGQNTNYKLENMDQRLGELLFTLIGLANNQDVDLEKAVAMIIEKYKIEWQSCK